MSDIYCNVRDFGAKGDGRTDDTDAFKSALAQAGKMCIRDRIPAAERMALRLKRKVSRSRLINKGISPRTVEKTISPQYLSLIHI